MSRTDQAIDIENHKAQIKQTFDTVADQYGRGGCRFFHSCGEHMAKIISLTGNETTIDLAAGTGATSIPLAKRLPNGNVTGVDLSDAMLAEARQYAESNSITNFDTCVGDFTKLPFPAEHFHHATCSFGLFFVPDMVDALKHISSKVKKGGRVAISGFCGDSFMPAAQLCMERLKAYDLEVPEQIAWRRMSKPEQLQELFTNAGLSDLAIDRKSFGYHVTPLEWWDVVWNAGFRGLVSQLGDKLEQFKAEHLKELESISGPEGFWMEIDVNFSVGTVN